jgi:hypothetical protein
VPRNTAPTLVSYTETVWNTGAATKTTASVSWQTGDVIVAILGIESNNSVVGAVTATGLSFTQRALSTATAGTICFGAGYTAVAGSTSSATVNFTDSSSVFHAGLGVWVWRGSDGFDAAAEQHTATKTAPLVHTDTHSAACVGVFDFQPGAVQTITPTPTNTRQAFLDGTSYTVYVSDLDDQASSGSVSYGISGGAGTGPFTIIGVGVLGTTSGSSASTPRNFNAIPFMGR